MLNCVDEPSSLGAAMPSVSKYAAVAPVAPVLPQLPQVNQGDSSTRLITVALLVGVGVGEGEGTAPGVGLGVGDAFGDDEELAEVEEEPLPPQDVSIRDTAKIKVQACTVRQTLMRPPIKLVSLPLWGDCKLWKRIPDYVENLRLGDYGVTGGHGRDSIWHMTLLEQIFYMKQQVFRTDVTCLL
jgi:hypothetical protein